MILSLTFFYLSSKNIELDSERFVSFLLHSNSFSSDKNTSKIKIGVLDLLNIRYLQEKNIKKVMQDKNSDYVIYLYNSHQTEEYQASDLVESSITPTVVINDYIMKDYFEKHNFPTLVEERSIADLLSLNKLNYAGSYIASRIYLEDVKKMYPSLTYFIDIHRDSLKKEKTTVTIGDKKYASVLFIVGLENQNYQKNYEFTNQIHTKINERYPNLSKGILQKGGSGVNGVYNQDFSPYTILIEIGGEENTIEEVMNTSLAVSRTLVEVISGGEG